MSVKSKHSSTKKEKIRKKEKRKKVEESEEDLESSEEELDLTKECHPIGYYMNDRPEMINQMFSVIKGNKLKAMLPPVLKDCDLEQLKLQCLDQLLGMSEKRIQCILEGEILETSSESEVPDSDEYESEERNGASSGSSSASRSEESDREDNPNEVENRHRKNKRKSDSMSDSKPGKMAKTDADAAQPEKGKTLLEILELEMRARAIRALLNQGGSENANEQSNSETKNNDSNQNSEKEVTGEVVDLTEGDEDEFPVMIKKEKPEEGEIDKQVSSFEERIEKSQLGEKSNQNQEDEKAKRLQAELELRNKLFKKKIYRTRQQRLENDEEDKHEKVSHSENNIETVVDTVTVKQEPVEEGEIVIEDPEEGEVSTSEDEYPVIIKQEPEAEPEEPEPEPVDFEPEPVDFEPERNQDGERICAIDNGTVVMNENLEYDREAAENEEKLSPEVCSTEESSRIADEESSRKADNEESSKKADDEESSKGADDGLSEGTSWRDRWLRKDGVQKLVKSSKIYAKVKKRIAEKSHRSKEESVTPYDVNSDSNNSNPKMEVIEGSIEEYEKLVGKSIEKSTDNAQGDFSAVINSPDFENAQEAPSSSLNALSLGVKEPELKTSSSFENIDQVQSSNQQDGTNVQDTYSTQNSSDLETTQEEPNSIPNSCSLDSIKELKTSSGIENTDRVQITNQPDESDVQYACSKESNSEIVQNNDDFNVDITNNLNEDAVS